MSNLTNQREQSEEFNTINKQLTKMKDELYELQLLINSVVQKVNGAAKKHEAKLDKAASQLK